MVRTLVSNSRTAISKSRGSDSDRSLVLLELLMSIEELNESSVSTAAAVALSVSTGVIVANLEGVPNSERSLVLLELLIYIETSDEPSPSIVVWMDSRTLRSSILGSSGLSSSGLSSSGLRWCFGQVNS